GKPKKPGMMERFTADPKPLTAFIVGVIMFGPSITFIAAVQVVATAKADLPSTVVAMAMIVVLTVLFACLPLVAYLVAPDFTTSNLRMLRAWPRRHRKPVVASDCARHAALP